MKKLLIFLFALGLLTTTNVAQGQNQPPYWDDIQWFKKQDSLKTPPSHAILFVGSSSFTKWQDVQNYFPNYPIINRGFGGSTLEDVTRYANDIIFPYKPKQIVIYCGENDLASDDTVSVQMVYKRFQQLYTIIRQKLPTTQVAYISMKPSPSRLHLMQKEVAANKLIKNFLEKQKNASFIDVYNLMLDSAGKPVESLFIEDMLHMNEKGYAIWQKAIEPKLVRSLKK